ncbi:MAG: dihydrofolate reductase [Bacteroidales bacterium]|nr:dihydrofolate reductase [Bacteroidales bacterium]
MKIAIIVAASENNVIGDGKGMIWHLSADLKRFRALTSGHTVLMGRKTYESIGRALPKRRNIVITRNAEYVAEGCDIFQSIDSAIDSARSMGEDTLFIIGGGELYHRLWGCADLLYLTRIHANADACVTIPEVLDSEWVEVQRELVPADGETPAYSFIDYIKKV